MRMLASIVATRARARSHRRAHTVAVTAIMGLRNVVAIAAAGIVVACGGSGSSGGAPSRTPLVEVGQLTVSGSYGILCVPLQNGEEYGVGYTAGPISLP